MMKSVHWTLLLLAMLCAAPASAQMPWRSLDWAVRCSAELLDLAASTEAERRLLIDEAIAANPDVLSNHYGGDRQRFAKDIGTWLERRAVKASRECEGAAPSDLPRLAEDQLERGSGWLEGLGFGGPLITPYELSSTEAALDPAAAALCRSSYCGAITFWVERPRRHGTYDVTDHYLRLNLAWARNLFPVSNLERTDVQFAYSPVHELFHAIQFGYEGFSSDNEIDWITEGTARLVQRVAADKFGTLVDPVLEHRHYDTPLHIQLSDARIPQLRTINSWCAARHANMKVASALLMRAEGRKPRDVRNDPTFIDSTMSTRAAIVPLRGSVWARECRDPPA